MIQETIKQARELISQRDELMHKIDSISHPLFDDVERLRDIYSIISDRCEVRDLNHIFVFICYYLYSPMAVYSDKRTRSPSLRNRITEIMCVDTIQACKLLKTSKIWYDNIQGFRNKVNELIEVVIKNVA